MRLNKIAILSNTLRELERKRKLFVSFSALSKCVHSVIKHIHISSKAFAYSFCLSAHSNAV